MLRRMQNARIAVDTLDPLRRTDTTQATEVDVKWTADRGRAEFRRTAIHSEPSRRRREVLLPALKGGQIEAFRM
jgi:hypothetical protein